MKLRREPHSVLLISSAERAVAYLSDRLEPGSYQPVTVVKSGSEARRRVLEAEYDLVIINAPLSDEFGHELAAYFAEQFISGILLLVKSDIFDEVAYKMEECGVLTLSKPLSRQLLDQALHLTFAIREKMRTMEQENVKLQVKMQEIRLVDRAKLTLVQCLKMSEPQAHRYIEKQAMDLRITKQAVAESILKTYEN